MLEENNDVEGAQRGSGKIDGRLIWSRCIDWQVCGYTS